MKSRIVVLSLWLPFVIVASLWAVDYPPIFDSEGNRLPLEGVQKMYGTEPLPPLPEGAFTLVVLPDTQEYTGKGSKATPDSEDPVENPNFSAQIDWILANKEKENIVFVTHVGDIVDRNTPDQWDTAKRILDRLRGVVPFSLTVGNHDIKGEGDASLFQEHFPASSFEKYPWYIGSFSHERADQSVSSNNVNSAQKFQAGGIDFLHLSLECSAPDEVLEWAGEILKKYPKHLAIVTTHMDLGVIEKPKTKNHYLTTPRNRMQWSRLHGERGNSPQQMWEKLYRHHPNLDFVLCGDQGSVTALRKASVADDGHTVISLLSDYMNEPVVRLMRFRPDQKTVEVLSYQVVDGFIVNTTIYVRDPDKHNFTVPLRVGRQ